MAQQAIPELFQKTGVGIQYAVQHRRTATTASLEVSLGSVTDEHYNTINGTSFANIYQLLINRTAASITVTCPDAPVESERTQIITGINLENDPVTIVDSSGNLLPDPFDWDGLGKRKFTFTQLEDRWYTVTVTTNCVANHGSGAVKTVTIRIRPKSDKRCRIVNIGCYQGSFGSAAYGTDDDIPIDAARAMINDGVDYVVTGDDFNYCRGVGLDSTFYSLPRDLSGNTKWAPGSVTDFYASMIDSTLNVPHSSATDNEIRFVHENLSTQMDPVYILLGMHCVVVPTDIGDHGIRLYNNATFDPICINPTQQLEYLVDYGQSNDETDVNPGNSATVFWIHDDNGGATPALDPYDMSGNAAQANIQSDWTTAAVYRHNCMVLFDYLHFSKWEHNIASAAPTTEIVDDYWLISGVSDPVADLGVNGYTLRPRWKYMDIGSTCRVYTMDASFFNVFRETLNNFSTLAAGIANAMSVFGGQQLSDLATHMAAAEGSFDYFVVINGDQLYAGDNSGNEYGNPDTAHDKVLAEWTTFKTLVEGRSIPVVLLTSDYHQHMIIQEVDGLIECHGSIGPLSGNRTPSRTDQRHQWHGGLSNLGYNRVYIDSREVSAVSKGAGQSIAGDDMTDRGVAAAGSAAISFQPAAARKTKEPKGVQIESKNFSMIQVR